MPLCLEWLDFAPSTSGEQRGNFIAVGTLDPEIEIWSLDVVDGIYPDSILGPAPSPTQQRAEEAESAPAGAIAGKKKKPKKPKRPAANASHHVDAVLALSWNRSHRSLLASASADKTVKLWDLSRSPSSDALRSFELHDNKVQALQWNAKQPTVLASGSWGGIVRIFDSRAPDAGVGLRCDADVEAIRWDPWEGREALVRATFIVLSQPLWALTHEIPLGRSRERIGTSLRLPNAAFGFCSQRGTYKGTLDAGCP
jgi:periodic tryptophan protein 1